MNNNVSAKTTDKYTSVSTNNEAGKNSTVSDLTKCIMKKDLLLSRLTQFNDRPEQYFSWKCSFKNITRELETTSTEELETDKFYELSDLLSEILSVKENPQYIMVLSIKKW